MICITFELVETDEEGEKEEEDRSVHPLASGLVTLSLLPKSRWCTLQSLDIIKVCVCVCMCVCVCVCVCVCERERERQYLMVVDTGISMG